MLPGYVAKNSFYCCYYYYYLYYCSSHCMEPLIQVAISMQAERESRVALRSRLLDVDRSKTIIKVKTMSTTGTCVSIVKLKRHF